MRLLKPAGAVYFGAHISAICESATLKRGLLINLRL